MLRLTDLFRRPAVSSGWFSLSQKLPGSADGSCRSGRFWFPQALQRGAALKGAEWGALVFLGLLATGAILLATHGGGIRKAFLAIWFAVMAPNILFVRQSPLLDPAASWHAYHLIIAVWLIAVIAGLKQTQAASLNRALSA